MGILYNKPLNPDECLNETQSITQFKYKFYNGAYNFCSEKKLLSSNLLVTF